MHVFHMSASIDSLFLHQSYEMDVHSQLALQRLLSSVPPCNRAAHSRSAPAQASATSTHCSFFGQKRELAKPLMARHSACTCVRASSGNGAVSPPWHQPDCRLALADGSVWPGKSFGATGQTIAEAVFNTSLTGYQEILTDASYKGQFVVFTHPHIGNTGINLGTCFPRWCSFICHVIANFY